MYLKPGDLVALVSPSRAISPSEVEASVAFLKSHGLRVTISQHVFDVNHQFAGKDQDKIQDIQEAINNPEVKAIWSTRGGYGSARIIDGLDFSSLKQDFKWFIGYSDFTVFHSHIHNQLAIPTLHATMPVNVSSEPQPAEQKSNETLINALFGKELSYALPEHELSRKGDTNGLLIGGNLSILYSLCGSASAINTRGKILFLEDLDEYLYHVDRMLMNLMRCGVLEGLAGLVVGGMSDMNDNTIPFGMSAEQIILSHVETYDYPVYFGLEAGHVQPNLALRLGMEAKIDDNRLILPA